MIEPSGVRPPDVDEPGRLRALFGHVALDLGPVREHPDFRRLWLAQAVSSVGSEAGYVALPYQVYALTGSTLAVGLLALTELVPMLTMTLVGGAFADAFDRRRSLTGSFAAVAVAAAVWGAALAAFGFATELWLALLLLAVAGGADLVSAVLRETMLYALTPDSLRGRLTGIEFAQVASAPAWGNLEAGTVASLTSLRASIVSGGIACVLGCVAVALAFPALIRYDAKAREPAPA